VPRTRVFIAGLVLLAAAAVRADDVLHPGMVSVDRPTVVTLGVQLLVTGDDNHNARVAVRYRPLGAETWGSAMDLFRVHPENVVGWTVPDQFAGSIFELAPGTTYDIELHATDPDGSVDQTMVVSATLRAVPPADPLHPRARNVGDAAGLRSALSAAERLTLQGADRALRFQGSGAQGNVVRRVHARDVRLGFGSKPDQKDFYICDNVLEGRLAWPLVYPDDGGAHSSDDGIHVEGDGHVVCHNEIVGFG